MKRVGFLVLVIGALMLAAPRVVFADQPEPAFTDDSNVPLETSPNEGWDEAALSDEQGADTPGWRKALMWPVNRVLDLIDIFHVDVGVGMTLGGVVRATENAQFGDRRMEPGALRVGMFGRRAPVMIEQSEEHGFGPNFKKSTDREVCPGEIGLGLDLFIVGGYAGVCADELADFVTGIFLVDFKKDDLK